MSDSNKNKPPCSPKWPGKLLEWFCPDELLEEAQGDLQERYYVRAKRIGADRARQQYFKDIASYIRLSNSKRKPSTQPLYSAMLLNYIKIALRNLRRYKAFSFINIFGLAVAMSVCMLIMLMLADQKEYDRFHASKDRIYRILSDRENSKAASATTPYPLSAILQSEYPIIEESTQVIRWVGGEVTYKDKMAEVRGYFADATFFNVFSYPLQTGNKENALISPNSMVITSTYAQQLFGNENPLGKTVQFVDRGGGLDAAPTNWGLFTITGVIDSRHYKSHLKFDVLVSSTSRQALIRAKKTEDYTGNWSNNQCYTYVLLQPGKTREDLTHTLTSLVASKQADLKDIKGFELIAQDLTSITPGILVSNEPSPTLPLVVYYFLSLLALIIMISACLNYTNLSTARALTRAKEIGIRKVNGAVRKDLMLQFISESILTAFFALALAIVFLIFIKPAFKSLWINQHLNFDLQGNYYVYVIFAGFALLIGILAGMYPAFYLSGSQPIKVLKNLNTLRTGKLGIRKVLSVTQFVVSLLFITTSILIYNQFNHFLSFDYRFNTKHIVNIPLQGNGYQKVSTQLNTVPGVSAISACNYIPATGTQNGISLKPVGSEQEHVQLTHLVTDENFVKTLGINLVAGSNLAPTTDSASRFILVNRAAVKELGYTHPSGIIGQVFESKWSKEALQVVGVVEDFVFRAPFGGTDKIGPLVLQNQPGNFSYVNVQISPGDVRATVARLEEKWQSIDAIHPFKYEFYDEQLATTNQALFDVVSILGFIAFLAIVIACLGMLGMATYIVERKTKEVGIRKVLGAGDVSIALLLSRGFLTILLISMLIGAPLSFILNNFWLQNFPNRVDFGLGTLLVSSITLLVLGLLTIGSQTIRASRRNPVDSLRME